MQPGFIKFDDEFAYIYINVVTFSSRVQKYSKMGDLISRLQHQKANLAYRYQNEDMHDLSQFFLLEYAVDNLAESDTALTHLQ